MSSHTSCSRSVIGNINGKKQVGNIYIYIVYQYFERHDLSFLGSYIQMTWSS